MHGVKNPDGSVFAHIVEATPTAAIEAMEEFTGFEWDELLKMGYLCIPVEVRELKEDMQHD